jgi:ABC-type nitrate/sulfonate/bicarbonate transport system substrate-binding protein
VHAGTLTIEPFTSIAKRSGFNVLRASTQLYDSYQGGIVAARRGWVKENPEPARAFIRGYLKGLAWTLDPANRAAAEALLLFEDAGDPAGGGKAGDEFAVVAALRPHPDAANPA